LFALASLAGIHIVDHSERGMRPVHHLTFTDRQGAHSG
jgi:hypothetical protein